MDVSISEGIILGLRIQEASLQQVVGNQMHQDMVQANDTRVVRLLQQVVIGQVYRIIICGEEQEMPAVMATVVLMILRGNDRVQLAITSQV
jgi:hypothetical protein